MNGAGMLGHRLLALHRLQRHLGLESRAELPLSFRHFLSFPTATTAISLGAGLSLSYLSYFPAPPQSIWL